MDNDIQPTDMLLLQAHLEAGDSDRWPAACAAAASALPCTLHRMAWSSDTGDAYAYLRLPQRVAMQAAALAPVRDALAQALPPSAQPRVSRLEMALDLAGASQSERPVFHYVVEMDPEAGWHEELMRWYDTEHMPGLASVPGTVKASRLLNHDHGPLSLACYDLVSTETLDSPPWLAVRATAWSDRVRPHFTHTRRTMFRTLGLDG